MKKLIEPIKTYLKKVFSDLHNAVVGAFVATVILSGGGIYLSSQKLWTQLKSIVLLPTPLWVAILMLLALLVYIRFAIFQARKTDINQSSESPPEVVKYELKKEQIEILIILYKQDNLQTEQVAQAIGSLPQAARFHLEELKSYNMVSFHMHRPIYNRNTPINVWSIIQAGRKYLHDNEMSA